MQIPFTNEHLFCKYFVCLSVGNATKGFATYGCFHPCLIAVRVAANENLSEEEDYVYEPWYDYTNGSEDRLIQDAPIDNNLPNLIYPGLNLSKIALKISNIQYLYLLYFCEVFFC